MQNAITCNAKAIFKIESRDYEGAFNLLRTSMLSLTETHHGSQRIQETSQAKSDSIILVSSRFDSNVDRFYSGSFLFSLPLNGMSPECISHRQIDFCSAACLFNMALACQLEFESSLDAEKRNKLLSQARILYLTAYQLMQKYPIEPTDPIVLLLMALCGNLIEIELELGSAHEVRFWKRILEDASYAADPLSFIGSSVYVFFDSVYIAPGEIRCAKAA